MLLPTSSFLDRQVSGPTKHILSHQVSAVGWTWWCFVAIRAKQKQHSELKRWIKKSTFSFINTSKYLCFPQSQWTSWSTPFFHSPLEGIGMQRLLKAWFYHSYLVLSFAVSLVQQRCLWLVCWWCPRPAWAVAVAPSIPCVEMVEVGESIGAHDPCVMPMHVANRNSKMMISYHRTTLVDSSYQSQDDTIIQNV